MTTQSSDVLYPVTRQALETLIPLTEAERLDARDRARHNVLRSHGPMPERDQFAHHTVGEYPRWLTVGVAVMLLIVFFAAANVSVFRVFTAGRDHFLATIDVPWQAAIVGVSAFVLAEFMVIAATIAQRIYFKGRDRWLMAVPITLGLLMAFVGNWAISQPEVNVSAAGLWSVLETATPPAAVLFMALIGERLILQTLRNRCANEIAYQAALKEWQAATAEPEDHAGWQRSYANALRELIREVNIRGRGAKDRAAIISQMDGVTWSAIVLREMRADDWFREVAPNTTNLIESHTVPQLKSPNGSTANLSQMNGEAVSSRAVEFDASQPRATLFQPGEATASPSSNDPFEPPAPLSTGENPLNLRVEPGVSTGSRGEGGANGSKGSAFNGSSNGSNWQHVGGDHPRPGESYLCACGCGETITDNGFGRPKQYVNDTHKKRAYRERLSAQQ